MMSHIVIWRTKICKSLSEVQIWIFMGMQALPNVYVCIPVCLHPQYSVAHPLKSPQAAKSLAPAMQCPPLIFTTLLLEPKGCIITHRGVC